jgi:hypothetical protein
MAKVIVELSMSLDGFVAGPNDGPENGLGDGGGVRLFDNLGATPIELESIWVIEAPGVTHLGFRVIK